MVERRRKEQVVGEKCITRGLVICAFHRLALGGQMKETHMGGFCLTHGREQKCIHSSHWLTQDNKTARKRQASMSITFNCNFKKQDGRVLVEFVWLGEGTGWGLL